MGANEPKQRTPEEIQELILIATAQEITARVEGDQEAAAGWAFVARVLGRELP